MQSTAQGFTLAALRSSAASIDFDSLGSGDPARMAAALGPVHGWALDLGRKARLHGVAPLVAMSDEIFDAFHVEDRMSAKEAGAFKAFFNRVDCDSSLKTVNAALAALRKSVGRKPGPIAAMLLSIGRDSATRAPILAAASAGVVIIVDIIGGALGALVGFVTTIVGAFIVGIIGAVLCSYIVI